MCDCKKGDIVLVITDNMKVVERIFLEYIEGSSRPYICVKEGHEPIYYDDSYCGSRITPFNQTTAPKGVPFDIETFEFAERITKEYEEIADDLMRAQEAKNKYISDVLSRQTGAPRNYRVLRTYLKQDEEDRSVRIIKESILYNKAPVVPPTPNTNLEESDDK